MVTFAALRFAEDGNLSDRTYWYRCDFALSPGERVLAPVGPHDRLQRAVVERVLEAGAENAPYDLRLIKSVAARDGARLLRAGGAVFQDGAAQAAVPRAAAEEMDRAALFQLRGDSWTPLRAAYETKP